MIVWMEMSSRTIIDYHAPFDRGFMDGSCSKIILNNYIPNGVGEYSPPLRGIIVTCNYPVVPPPPAPATGPVSRLRVVSNVSNFNDGASKIYARAKF